MKEQSFIICTRTAYSPQSTLGRITLTNNEYRDEKFCYSLEDTARADGVKVHGNTCIPENLSGYKIKKTYSPAFKRDTLQLYTDSSDLSISLHGIRFTGVRNHGGNKHEDTEGCPLTAYNLIQHDKKKDFIIQGRSDLDLMEWYDTEIEKGREVLWIVVNNNQSS